MDAIPTNQEVAAILEIDESSVKEFRQETHRLQDGAWLIQFAYWMPKELRQGLTGSFTLTITLPQDPLDRRERQ
ncbi:hypothetical protein E6B08_23780 [Pseudomonas putida]|uniref:Uncharacterized protein n=1 Tax=Pseudomonas putida TaxID=303 RepID=A0A4D6XMZ6_PSEPU|nr:hypothetical protein [Pseudomonas putida]QCI14175.1 hypothetical protein E6B08_23780 [Pseudomonas putida]